MIIKAVRRGNGGRLAAYLLREHKGDRDSAHLLDLRGFTNEQNLDVALRSVELEAEHTRCQKPLYHASLRPDQGERLTEEQWQQCIEKLEHRLGLEGQPRAVVRHQHKDKEHRHVVWSLIERERDKAIHLTFDRERCTEVAREFEREHGLRELAPAHKRTREPLTRADYERARRRGQDPEHPRAAIRSAWEHSDDGKSLVAALEERGLVLAKGDRRDFVAVDERGGVHSIGKRATGASAAEVRARLADLDRDAMPSVEQVREERRARGGESERSKEIKEERKFEPGHATPERELEREPEERVGQPPPLDRAAEEAEREKRRAARLDATLYDRADMVSMQRDALLDMRERTRERQQDEQWEQRQKEGQEQQERREAERQEQQRLQAAADCQDGTKEKPDMARYLTDEKYRQKQLAADAERRKREKQERQGQEAGRTRQRDR